MIQIHDANYVPDLDSARIPGSIISMSGFAPLQRGFYGSVSTNSILSGMDTDVTRVQTFRQIDDTVRFLIFRKTDIEEWTLPATFSTRLSSADANSKWDAAAWGNMIIATNYYGPVKKSTATTFSDLGGTPPQARYIAANVNFVMLADTNDVSALDDGGVYSDMVWWSALRNPEDWEPDIATQAGNNRLLDTPGPIRKLIAFRDKFIAFKANSIYVGEYIGPPLGFQWRLLSSRLGLAASDGVCEMDDKLYFVHESGVFEFDGAAIRNVGLPAWHAVLNKIGHTTITSGSSIGGIPSPASGQSGTSLSLVRMAGDDIEGVVWLAVYTQTVLNLQYRMHLYAYNTRSGKWAEAGQFVIAGINPPVLVNTTHADMRTFHGESANKQARIWYADNVAALYDIRYPAAWASSLSGNLTTGLQGTTEGSQSTMRVYTRSMEGSSDAPFGTCTIYGYTNEQRTLGEQSQACVANSELESWDGMLHSRFRQARLVGTTGKTCILAGVGIEYPPVGRR